MKTRREVLGSIVRTVAAAVGAAGAGVAVARAAPPATPDLPPLRVFKLGDPFYDPRELECLLEEAGREPFNAVIYHRPLTVEYRRG